MTVSLPNKSMDEFMNNLKSKIREDIAGMIPDNVVAEMAQQVLKEEFFGKRKEETGGWNSKTIIKPSQFEEMVLDAAKPMILSHVIKLLEENPTLISDKINDILDIGFKELVVSVLKRVVINTIQENPYVVTQAINSMNPS